MTKHKKYFCFRETSFKLVTEQIARERKGRKSLVIVIWLPIINSVHCTNSVLQKKCVKNKEYIMDGKSVVQFTEFEKRNRYLFIRVSGKTTIPHRAMFKLGAKNLFLLCLLIKKKSAVYSADRCNFSEPETDCSRNENNLYKSWVEGALNSGPFGHFRFANHLFNWQILIKVWTSVIGLSCFIRTILENEKVR